MAKPEHIERILAAHAWMNEKMAREVPEMESLDLWVGCPFARYDNETKGRVFAHTNHIRGVVCVAEKIGRLSTPYLMGIMAHEFGHEIAIVQNDDLTELGADAASDELLGLPIHYGSELKLQFLKDFDSSELEAVELDLDAIHGPKGFVHESIMEHLPLIRAELVSVLGQWDDPDERDNGLAMEAYRYLVKAAPQVEVLLGGDDTHDFLIVHDGEREGYAIDFPRHYHSVFAYTPLGKAIVVTRISPAVLERILEDGIEDS